MVEDAEIEYQVGNHESQCYPEEAASDELDFMLEIRKKVSKTNCEKIWYQCGLNLCFLCLSLQTNFRDERGKDSHHPYFPTRHKMGHSCSDSVCRLNNVASNVNFQR